MKTEVLVALITLLGSGVGTFGGVTYGLKFLGYRIEQLEKKVEKHNNVIERTYILEEKQKTANHRIDDLESKVG
ncbi:hypothetical protein [Vagococcus fessus]|uniref:Uncharacterized protein n=1 Tax=Vagococcus fessus TaxID=120370 RepID=A0A430A595_9ENTE|nr:hypothetical protein [Vagococcus fessus]RSU01972.1 hypothetical protein CBF31_09400 [Vagococcus fessus]